jgi:hypothetical protein
MVCFPVRRGGKFLFAKASRLGPVPTDLLFSGFWDSAMLATYFQKKRREYNIVVITLLTNSVYAIHPDNFTSTWTYVYFRNITNLLIPVISRFRCVRSSFTRCRGFVCIWKYLYQAVVTRRREWLEATRNEEVRLKSVFFHGPNLSHQMYTGFITAILAFYERRDVVTVFTTLCHKILC